MAETFTVCYDALDRILPYSTVWPVGYLRFGEGTLATYGPGSRRIVDFREKMKVLKPE